MNIKILSITALALILSTGAAQAEKGGNGHGKQKNEIHPKEHKASHNNDVVIIDNSNRVVIREYISDSYSRKCPPGLAKKHNGCLPPGQAKKRYEIGRPLEVVWEPLPGYVLTRLDPPPYGYTYVKVDQDVLLIGEASKKVIDAVTLLSAVGN